MPTTTATDEQQTPDGEGGDIAKLIQRDLAQQGGFPRIEADIKARADLGKERYGERLHSHNGRDPIQDAYQEVLDLMMYLRQAIAEGHEVGAQYWGALRTARDLREHIDRGYPATEASV